MRWPADLWVQSDWPGFSKWKSSARPILVTSALMPKLIRSDSTDPPISSSRQSKVVEVVFSIVDERKETTTAINAEVIEPKEHVEPEPMPMPLEIHLIRR